MAKNNWRTSGILNTSAPDLSTLEDRLIRMEKDFGEIKTTNTNLAISLEKMKNAYSEVRSTIHRLVPEIDKIEGIDKKNKEYYEELKTAINDLDTKVFIASTKQEKEMSTVNNAINDIQMEN